MNSKDNYLFLKLIAIGIAIGDRIWKYTNFFNTNISYSRILKYYMKYKWHRDKRI
jgi:hypothetical protein